MSPFYRMAALHPVSVRADVILRGVEDGSIPTRPFAERIANELGGETLYAVRRRLDVLDAVKRQERR